MGCENQPSQEDLDIITSSGTIGDLKITTVPPPEIENDGCTYITFELSSLLKEKFRKQGAANIKFKEISTEEFDLAFNHNYFANDIYNLYKTKLDLIKYEEDIFFQNVNPIKITDTEKNVQYYQGGFNSKGQAQGRGIWIKDFNIYIGNFKDDEFSGTGLFINEQGDYYFGQWKNGNYDGYGTLVVGKKLAYRGFFKNGKKEGFGEEKSPEGDYYNGAFFEGEKNGKGEYLFSDGTNYQGYFRNSKYSGFGNIDLGNGEYVTGKFKEGKLNGEGNLGLGDGTLFEGNFNDDMKNGEGKYTWKDGKSYVGYWKDDNAFGQGIYFDPKAEKQEENIIIS